MGPSTLGYAAVANRSNIKLSTAAFLGNLGQWKLGWQFSYTSSGSGFCTSLFSYTSSGAGFCTSLWTSSWQQLGLYIGLRSQHPLGQVSGSVRCNRTAELHRHRSSTPILPSGASGMSVAITTPLCGPSRRSQWATQSAHLLCRWPSVVCGRSSTPRTERESLKALWQLCTGFHVVRKCVLPLLG